MLKNFFTNTKSRWNIKYLFKNNNKNKPNAITYRLSHDLEVHSMHLQLLQDKQKFFLMSSF